MYIDHRLEKEKLLKQIKNNVFHFNEYIDKWTDDWDLNIIGEDIIYTNFNSLKDKKINSLDIKKLNDINNAIIKITKNIIENKN